MVQADFNPTTAKIPDEKMEDAKDALSICFDMERDFRGAMDCYRAEEGLA